jgi:hypothetical protein
VSPRGERVFWLTVAAFGAVLIVAISLFLKPDPRGFGTHESLGLPPCGLMVLTHVPCPSCGMTTSFAHSARLEVRSAFRAHPMGPILFGALVLGGGLALAGLLGAISPERLDRWVTRLPWGRVAVVFMGIFILTWSLRVWEALRTP